jgi:hypothetical protein
MNSARVPAVSALPNAATISIIPPAKAQIPTTSTSTSAVGPGQTRAATPAASAISDSSRWPKTGPAAFPMISFSRSAGFALSGAGGARWCNRRANGYYRQFTARIPPR